MGALRALRELGASFSRADVLVLCYHSVRLRERFAAQMTALAERGYSVVSLPYFTRTRSATSGSWPATLSRSAPARAWIVSGSARRGRAPF
jgi:hypothetical protein